MATETKLGELTLHSSAVEGKTITLTLESGEALSGSGRTLQDAIDAFGSCLEYELEELL